MPISDAVTTPRAATSEPIFILSSPRPSLSCPPGLAATEAILLLVFAEFAGIQRPTG
jgi:hypothetical protein